LAAKKLELNDIGICVSTWTAPRIRTYRDSRVLGGFILIDRLTNNTVGAGLLHFALRRSQNVHWQALDVNKIARARLSHQKPCILWFTGLSAPANRRLPIWLKSNCTPRRHTYLLDGDNVRHGLNKDCGVHRPGSRREHPSRAEVARLMIDAGLIVLVSFISPFRSERHMARALVEAGEFIEVFVDTPLAMAEARDVKGLYKKRGAAN